MLLGVEADSLCGPWPCYSGQGESQAQVSKCAHSGCLRKQGGVRKNWLKRWFVADDLLHPKLIFYYDSGGKKLGTL